MKLVPADSKTRPIATYKKDKSHVVPYRIGKIQTRHIVSHQGASRWVFSTDRRHQDHRHQDQRHLGHQKLAILWISPATVYLKTQALVDWIAKKLMWNVIFVRSEEEDKKKYVCLFTGRVHQSPNSRCSGCSTVGALRQFLKILLFALPNSPNGRIAKTCCSVFAEHCSVEPGYWLTKKDKRIFWSNHNWGFFKFLRLHFFSGFTWWQYRGTKWHHVDDQSNRRTKCCHPDWWKGWRGTCYGWCSNK